MNLIGSPTAALRPRWDGSRVLFEITDGHEQVPCAISRAALQDISETLCLRTADLLQCFANARGRIERLARDKLLARPAGISGRLGLWANDMDDVPPAGGVWGLPGARAAEEDLAAFTAVRLRGGTLTCRL